MALAEQLPVEAFLKERHVHFDLAPHAGTFTAKSEARALGLPAHCVLKVVVLRTDDDLAIAVLPASRKIDMTLLTHVVPGSHIRLATEDEISVRYPGYDLGAIPPLPDLLGVRAYVDPRVFDPTEVAFADGLQTESMISSPQELFWGENVFVAPISREPDVEGMWAV